MVALNEEFKFSPGQCFQVLFHAGYHYYKNVLIQMMFLGEKSNIYFLSVDISIPTTRWHKQLSLVPVHKKVLLGELPNLKYLGFGVVNNELFKEAYKIWKDDECSEYYTIKFSQIMDLFFELIKNNDSFFEKSSNSFLFYPRSKNASGQ